MFLCRRTRIPVQYNLLCIIFALLLHTILLTIPDLQLYVLLGSIQALILSLLLISRRHNRRPNRILGIMLFVVFLHLLIVANDNPDFFRAYPHVSRVSWILSALYGPLIYMYVHTLLSPRLPVGTRQLWPLLPVAGLLLLKMPFFVQGAAEKRAFMAQWDRVLEEDYGWFNQLVNLLDLFFMFASIWYYRRYLARLHDEFSDIGRRRMQWLRHFLYAVTAVMLLATLLFNARRFHIPLLEPLHGLHFIGMVLLMYWIAYRALSQPELFTAPREILPGPLPQEAGIPVLPAGTAKPAPPAEPLLQQQAALLEKIIRERRLFIRNELNLAELATESGFSRHQVSEIINSCFGRNFYDYINDFRLEEFKRLAQDPASRNLTILGLALESGFNSKATFNSFFRRRTGMTPSEYVKSLK